MKKLFIFMLMALMLTGCGAMQVSAQEIDTEYRTPQPTATASIVPTATIEYQATAHAAETQAYIAQSTADAANRIMVQATNDQQQREHEAQLQNAQGTAQAEANHMIELGWTATAYQTSMPLTATAQVDNMTAIADYKAVTIAQITATAAYPTQIVAESNARTQAKYAPVYVFVQVFAIFAIGVFLLFTAWFMRWYWMQQDKREYEKTPKGVAQSQGFKEIPNLDEQEPEFVMPQPDPRKVIDTGMQPATVLTIQNETGTTSRQMVVPCKPNQLLELAENTLTKSWSLAINAWEGAETSFTRGTFSKVRSWLQGNKFAISTGGGALVLTDEGRAFLEAYLNTSNLPTEYEFGNEATA